VQTDTSSDSPARRGAEVRTFLIADVRGYTRYTREHGDEAASQLTAKLAEVVREVVPHFHGDLLELRGDEAMSVFFSAREAIRAAVQLQRRLRQSGDGEPTFPLGVGMGIDSGEAVPTEGGYRGGALNLAARLCAVAKPGQILASDHAAHLAGRVDGVRLVDRRPVRLKGMEKPVRLVEVEPEVPLPPLPAAPGGRRRRRRRIAVAAAVGLLVAAAIGLAAWRSTGGTARVHAPPPVFEGIWRINASTGQIAATMPVLPPRVGSSLVYGLGSLWATTPTGIIRIDPRRDRVVGRIPYTGAGPLAIDGHRLITTGGGTGTNNVSLIDPADPNGSDFTVFLTQPFNPNHLQGGFYPAVGYGSLWIRESGALGCCGGRTFWRISLRTHRRVASWRNPDAFGVGPEGVWLVYGDRLARIDPGTNRLHTVPRAGPAFTVAVGDGAVWTADRHATVREIDPTLGRVVWHHTFPTRLPDSIARIVAGYGAVWIEDVLDDKLWRIDSTTKRYSAAINLPDNPGTLAISPGALWVRFPAPSDTNADGDARLS
jgi:class 3 adenylate cyclase